MKSLILVLLIGFCSSEEQSTTWSQCNYVIRLNTGQVLERVVLDTNSMSLDKCDTNDFNKCAKDCNQKISNETNGFDLDKPRAGEQTDMSLGQSYCNRIKGDVDGAKFMVFVTLHCKFERDIKGEQNGTVVSIGSTASESYVSRYIGSGFKQKIRCVDNKYTKVE